MKCLLLLSGGFDSPVAGHLLRKKSVNLVAVHFSGKPFINDTAEKKAIKLAKMIGCEKLINFPFGKIQGEVVNTCRHRFYYIITKRIMFRIAERLAIENGCDFIATGDNLGQVGSQTLKNMAVINSVLSMPLVQPLLAFDKQEIIDKARDINTYDTSKGPEMCSVLGPKHPATGAKEDIIAKEESRLDIAQLIKSGYSDLEVVQ